MNSVNLIQIGTDPYTNDDNQHSTAIEPDSFSFGSIIVTAFQVGRVEQRGVSQDALDIILFLVVPSHDR